MTTGWKPKINLSTGIKKIIEYEKKKLINILISSFSEVKFPLYNYIVQTKNFYSRQSKVFLSNKKKNLFINFLIIFY